MSKRLLWLMFMLCFVAYYEVYAQQPAKNLTTILKELSAERNISISFSPTLTNNIYPKNVVNQGDINAVLSKLLSGTSLAFKLIKADSYYIYKKETTAQTTPKPTSSAPSAPKVEPVPEPEPEKKIAWSIKTNALADVTTTLNLAAEAGFCEHWSVELSVYGNPWNFKTHSYKHLLIQPEGRYWLGTMGSGHFVGLHVHYGLFNVSDWPTWSNWIGINDYIGTGWMIGGGISYGYSWALTDSWHIEAALGVGYSNLRKENINSPYFGLTKLSCGISYRLP